jgi:hypothetical protein
MPYMLEPFTCSWAHFRVVTQEILNLRENPSMYPVDKVARTTTSKDLSSGTQVAADIVDAAV